MAVVVVVRMIVSVVMVVMAVMVLVAVFVGVGVIAGLGHDDVNLCPGDAAAHDLAGFEAGSDVERGCRALKNVEGETGVDHGAEEHVAADTGEAIEIGNPHRCDSKSGGGARADLVPS